MIIDYEKIVAFLHCQALGHKFFSLNANAVSMKFLIFLKKLVFEIMNQLTQNQRLIAFFRILNSKDTKKVVR